MKCVRHKWSRSIQAVLLCALIAGSVRAQQPPSADVVVLDDTSGSMIRNDPHNSIVLVTRLFADIVPGKLSAVRLIDLGRDGSYLDMKPTGQVQPCPDAPTERCNMVKMADDALERVVARNLLIESRSQRGDTVFKDKLPDLLRPSAKDTSYSFSFATIEKQFREDNSPAGVPRLIVWLSDGAPDAEPGDWSFDQASLQRMAANGVAVRALVFKSGNSQRVEQAGIKTDRVDGSASDLMKAFAGVFRQIMGAPYSVDGVVTSNPRFTIKPNIGDAWVVIYGDESLSSASVSLGGQTVPADYASDHYNGSAYRVAYLKNPPAGEWTVHVSGGGSGASYAVIQRSTLVPFIYPVDSSISPGVPFRFIASLRGGEGQKDLLPSDLPEPVTLDATIDGQTVRLTDDGQNGDLSKDDGRYSAMLTVQKTGPFVVSVHAHNSFLDRTVEVTLEAHGFFRYAGGPIDIDFGSLKAGQTRCRDLNFSAGQQGAILFELRSRLPLPPGYALELRSGSKHIQPGNDVLSMLPQDARQICLVTTRDAGSSTSDKQNWVDLTVRGHQDMASTVVLRSSWSVRGLTFWERWGWLILLILAVLLVWFIIYGYIRPFRFPPGLALCFAPEMSDLDDQTPQPVRLWPGVRIGFYRDARACLHDNFRVNGIVKGAAAILQAGPRRAVIVKPAGRALYREVGYNEWDQVPPAGRRAAQGDIYRMGESGPYFRISTRMTV